MHYNRKFKLDGNVVIKNYNRRLIDENITDANKRNTYRMVALTACMVWCSRGRVIVIVIVRHLD